MFIGNSDDKSSFALEKLRLDGRNHAGSPLRLDREC
jgi:hypothetical protein